jgi:hypothetical protein
MRRLAKAARLSAGDWCVLLRAGALLPVARIAVRVLTFRGIRSWVQQRPLRSKHGRRRPASPERVAYLVDLAARYCLWKPTCLERSLTLYRLLRKMGVEARFVVGTKVPPAGFAAHAWVEHNGRVLGGQGEDGYQELLSVENAAIRQDL